VLGSTGAQGGPVARALLSAGRPVRAIGRNPEGLRTLAALGAEPFAVDLSDGDALATALDGVSGAFLHLPFLPVEPIVRAQATALTTAMRRAQVPLAVFTLSGTAAREPLGVPSFDTKALAKSILTEADLPLIGFEPTGYLGNLLAFGAGSVVQHSELRYPLPEQHRQAWISTEDQAALALAALDRPDLAGSWFALGERFTGPELAAAIGRARGHDVRYVAISPQEFGAGLAAVLGPEAGAAVAADYAALGSRPDALPLDADTEHVRRELGVPATPIEEWARAQDWEGAALAAA